MSTVVKLLDAVSSPAVSETLVFLSPRNVALNVQVTRTGTPTDIVLRGEGSIDGVTFIGMGGDVEVNTTDKVLPNPFLYTFSASMVVAFRFNLVSMSGGSSPTVSAIAAVTEGSP